MFTRSEGLTHLRPELVRALAFSLEHGHVQTELGRVRVRSGLVGVWNGRVGQVLVLIQLPEFGRVDRWSYSQRIDSEKLLDEAVRAGLSSAECLVEAMDNPEFVGLDPESQSERLERWEDFRKPPIPADADTARVPRVELPANLAFGNPADSAVLGRVSVVRRRIAQENEAD